MPEIVALLIILFHILAVFDACSCLIKQQVRLSMTATILALLQGPMICFLTLNENTKNDNRNKFMYIKRGNP